jgi:hypothetical protein
MQLLPQTSFAYWKQTQSIMRGKYHEEKRQKPAGQLPTNLVPWFTFQLSKGWLNDVAPENILSIL